MGPVVGGAPTILAVQTDSAWVVILAVALVTLLGAAAARRLIGRPGGLASGVLLTLPLALPILAAFIFDHAVLPEVGVLTPFNPATMQGSSKLLNLLLMADEGGRTITPYTLTASAGPWLVGFAAVASAVMLLRRGAGSLLLHRLVGRCATPAQAGAHDAAEMVAELASAAGLPRVPQLLILPRTVSGAFAVGLRQGKVLISRDVLAALEPRELEAILAHEIAHLRARDVSVMCVAGFLRDLVAWNPLAHVAFRQLAANREDEADRRAAGLTGRPLAVASGLLRVRGLMRARPGYAQRSALAAVRAGGGPVAGRVTRLIALSDAPTSPPGAGAGGVAYVAAACLVAVMGLQAGSRIAGGDQGALALVVGQSPAAEAVWGPRMYPVAQRRAPHRHNAAAKAHSRPPRPGVKARLGPTFKGSISVKEKDLSRWLRTVNRLTAKQGRAIKTQWDLRQSWQAVPLFSTAEVAPLRLYRIGQTPL